MVQNANIIQTRRNYTPIEVIRQPIFWLMYFMFVIVGAGGLMVTANLKPIARRSGRSTAIPVTLMALTMTAVTFAATIDRVLNGLTRPFFGWISDMIGRENTMFIAFGMEGIGIWVLYLWGHDPVWFVLLVGLRVLRLGRDLLASSRRPAPTRSARNSPTTNAGLLYTAKGTAALLVPVANYMQQHRGLGPRVPDRRRRQHPGVAAGDRGSQAVAGGRGRARPADLAAGLNVRPGGNTTEQS